MTIQCDKDIYKQIIQTEEFLRLNDIIQIGFVFYICPNVNHTRADHCKGVYERAEHFLNVLEKNSKIQINEFHKRCVKIAGLLHDIGHGPFSHFWEQVVDDFKHEENGLHLVLRIFNKVQLSEDNKEHMYGVELISKLILGDKTDFQWKYEKEEFIFEIINNKTCDIDIDRLDYLHRDWESCAKYVHIQEVDVEENLKKVDKLFEGARISPDKKHIQFRRAHIENINCMFRLRKLFHEYIYQMREVKIFEDIAKSIIRLKRENIEDVGEDLTKLSGKDVEFNKLDDKCFWNWLNKDSKLKGHLNVFQNIREKINIFEKSVTGSIQITISYEYPIKTAIEDCLYGDSQLGDVLKMEYNFKDEFYYTIKH